MTNKIYVILEGESDRIFFDHALRIELEKKYTHIGYYEYAQRPNDQVKSFIKIIRNQRSPYIFITDIDAHTCYTEKKKSVSKLCKDSERIVVVKAEIESWYLAGLTQSDAKLLDITHYTNTEEITKEMFNDLWQNKFLSRIDFSYEILKKFSIDEAKKNNKSFQYFCKKFL